jgi:hypothetical protein
MSLKISPQTALWYKNKMDSGKDIFTRKRLYSKRRPFNIHQKAAFCHYFLLFPATERGCIWFPCLRNSYLLTYLITPCSRVLLEKLTGSADSQEIPRILWNPKEIVPWNSLEMLKISRNFTSNKIRIHY